MLSISSASSNVMVKRIGRNMQSPTMKQQHKPAENGYHVKQALSETWKVTCYNALLFLGETSSSPHAELLDSDSRQNQNRQKS